MDSNLEKFGKIFIDNVRDRTLETFINFLNGKERGNTAKKINELLTHIPDDATESLKRIVEEMVDQCLFNILDMLENDESVEITCNGNNVAELSDGLAGELYSEAGWIAKYSKYHR